MNESRTCKSCGSELPENQTVCPSCGTDNAPGQEITDVKARGFSSKRNIIIIAAAAVLLAGGVTAAAVISSQPASQSEVQLLELARRYLSESNYEQAIIEFRRVLDIQPDNTEAYIGLAKAYIGVGDYDSAEDILRKGLDITGSDSIKALLEQITGGAEEVPAQAQETQSEPAQETQESVDEPHTEQGTRLSSLRAVMDSGNVSETSYQWREDGSFICLHSHVDADGNIRSSRRLDEDGNLVYERNSSNKKNLSIYTRSEDGEHSYILYDSYRRTSADGTSMGSDCWYENTPIYDASGRLSEVKKTVSYSYILQNGSTESGVREETQKYTYETDAAGNVIRETIVNYDENGEADMFSTNISEFSYNEDGTRDGLFEYYYDDRGILSCNAIELCNGEMSIIGNSWYDDEAGGYINNSEVAFSRVENMWGKYPEVAFYSDNDDFNLTQFFTSACNSAAKYDEDGLPLSVEFTSGGQLVERFTFQYEFNSEGIPCAATISVLDGRSIRADEFTVFTVDSCDGNVPVSGTVYTDGATSGQVEYTAVSGG